MDIFISQNAFLYWITAGIFLIILEIVVPGAILVFFGAGAVLTGVILYFGFIEDPYFQLLFWSASSLLLILFFRRYLHLWFPALERYKPVVEADELIGKEAEVIEEINSKNDTGRIRYQGTSWKAKSLEGDFPAGSMVKIYGRKNITLLVK